MNLLEYYLQFVAALRKQLEADDERWGNEWKKRPIEAGPADPTLPSSVAQAHWAHQNDRVYNRISDYYKAWKHKGEPIPWLKVCGNAFIAWVRETHPDTYMLEDEETSV